MTKKTKAKAAAEILPPNWHVNSSTTGGSVDEIPRPSEIVRFWPKGLEVRRRNVRIQISHFAGYTHHCVSINEEDNPFWNGASDTYNKEGTWQHVPLDIDGKGMQIESPRFHTRKEALAFVFNCLRLFDPKTHHVTFSYGVRELPNRWVPPEPGELEKFIALIDEDEDEEEP